MSLRLHLAVVLLLFPSLMLAQGTAATPQPAPAASSHVPYPVGSSAAIARARQIAQWFDAGQTAQLWPMFSPELQKQWQSPAKLALATKRVAVSLGAEKKVVLESTVPGLLHANTDYSRLSQFSKTPAQILTVVALSEQGMVEAILFRPVPDVPLGQFAGYKDQTKFKLPFSGQWMVYQGGRSLIQSAHLGGEEERYALDFVLLKDGRPFSGDGSKNDQFYCFGQPILAPADGTVVRLQNTSADNDPGKGIPEQGLGNNLIISHGNNEYSLLSQLKRNSITVKKGEKVKQGQQVAACGNSGASNAPHIQYRLQNSHGYPLPLSLPIQFVEYVADGKPLESGEPVRGQLVSNGERTGTESAEAAPTK